MTLNTLEGHRRSPYSLNSKVIEGQFCNCYTTFSRQFPPYIDFLNNVHDFHLNYISYTRSLKVTKGQIFALIKTFFITFLWTTFVLVFLNNLPK